MLLSLKELDSELQRVISEETRKMFHEELVVSASGIMYFISSATSDKCMTTVRKDSWGEIGLSVDAADSRRLRLARRKRSAMAFHAMVSGFSKFDASAILQEIGLLKKLSV